MHFEAYLDTAMVAPLKNLSELIKNRTFLAFFSLDALSKEGLWPWLEVAEATEAMMDGLDPFKLILGPCVGVGKASG